mgnify:FL=1
MKSLDNVRKRAYNIITANANERKAENHRKDGESMEDEYSILLKSLNVAVGEVQTRKILEQFKAVAIENHLDYSRRLLHDFLRVAELELNLHHLHNK